MYKINHINSNVKYWNEKFKNRNVNAIVIVIHAYSYRIIFALN